MESGTREPEDLEQLLERMGEAEPQDGEVTLDAMLDAIGHRSFGPLLLMVGVITMVPGPADIPGVPAVLGIVVLLTAGQLILRRDHIWLPGWLLRRGVKKEKLDRAIGKLQRPAAFIDRFVRPRLTGLVHGPGAYAVAVCCMLIGIAFFPMEFIPFSANLGGAALTGFGLALIVRDGVLGLVAYGVTAAAVAVVLYNLL